MDFKKLLFISVLSTSLLMGCNNTTHNSINKIIDVIYVDTDPDKMIYCVGETFDPTGMVVNAYYQDETEGEITGWTYDNHDPLDNGDLKRATITITISYEEYTTELDITVVDSMEGIGSITGLKEVNKPLLQKAGTSFDSTDCTFKVLFDGQESEKIYKYGENINGNSYNQIKVSSNAKIEANQKSVGINYSQGQEYALPIVVADKIVVNNSKQNYVANVDEFNFSTLSIVPNITNGGEISIDPSKLTFVDEVEGNITNGSKFIINGEHVITAKYSKNFDLTFKINVTGGSDGKEADQDANVDLDILEFENKNYCELIDNSENHEVISTASSNSLPQVQDLRNYPGEYAPSNKDFIRCVSASDQMKLTVKSFGGKANLILRGATNNVTLDHENNKYIAYETQINQKLSISVNNKDVEIKDTAKFRGKVGKDETVDRGIVDGYNYSGRYLYCLWTEINLGEINLKNGTNEILITMNDKGGGFGHYDCLKLDYLPYKTSGDKKFVNDGDLIKVEAEDLTLNGTLSRKADRTDLWPDAHSSNDKYVQGIVENDTMTYTFKATQDGYVKYSIAGASNYCPVNNSSTPSMSYDMYLVNVMKIFVNDSQIKLNENLKFNGVTSENGKGDRKVLTSYQLVEALMFKVEKNKDYSIQIQFVHSGDGENYKHAYDGEAYGNYDYVTLQYGHYE